MPKIFSIQHDKLIRLYLKRGGKNSIFQKGPRQIWATNREGYVEECKLDVRVVPDLMNGIKIMGGMYKIRNNEDDQQQIDKFA